MRIAVAGARGQLGRAIARRAAVRGYEVIAGDRPVLDVRDPDRIARWLDEARPALAINAAAHTAVDRAEHEPDLAFAINAEGPARLARACRAREIPLFHISTDYVFDGAAVRPYREDDSIGPMSVYGASKAHGERAAREHGAVVVRTSWLFGQGGPSFVHSILRLVRERECVRVVADQVGCPTWVDDLAGALLDLAARRREHTLYHYCNAGATSWHGLACAIVDEARRHGPIACAQVVPVGTDDYRTAARRPAYSVLDTTRMRSLGIATPSWRDGLARVVTEELAR